MKNSIQSLLTAITLLILFVSSCNFNQTQPVNDSDPPSVAMNEMLNSWGSAFMPKIDSNYTAIVNFEVTDQNPDYHIQINNNNFSVFEGAHNNPHFVFQSTLAHYNKIYRQEITGFTSVGRENMSDQTPLDLQIKKPVTNNPINDLLFFLQRFFNTSAYDKVVLDEEHSRIVHGAHAIPLFYQTSDNIGLRSAWYMIKKGQQVNEPGDTNPFPQYFIVIKGEGFACIGKDTIAVKSHESYFVPPGKDHIFWNESETPMEMIFLAYGEGA